MPGLLGALFLRIVSNPIANAFQKSLSTRTSSISVNFYISLVMSLMCLLPALRIDWTTYSAEFWCYVLLAGAFCTLGTICLIKALHYGELSILGPLNSYKSVIGLISAFILLGETPSGAAITGVFLIVGGSLLFIIPQKGSVENKKIWISIWLRFAALVLTGCEASILKRIIQLSSPEISFILWCFAGLLFGAVFILLSGKRLEAPTGRDLPKYFAAVACLAIMQLSTNAVFSQIEVGPALALFQLSSLINIFLGVKIFKEGGILRKIAGTLIMISGSVLILCLR